LNSTSIVKKAGQRARRKARQASTAQDWVGCLPLVCFGRAIILAKERDRITLLAPEPSEQRGEEHL
jgi:hypothetical protein